MVAPAGAVGVELPHRHLALGQILARRRGRFERTGGGDVVGRHHVAEDREHLGAFDILDLLGVHGHALEIGRVLNVGRRRGPVVDFRLGRLHALPFLIALKDVCVFGDESLAGDGLFDQFRNLLRGRPDVFQEDVIAVLVLTERFRRQIDVQRPGQRVSDDQRRGGEVVRPHVRADPPLEVAVAGKDGGGDQIALRNRLRQFRLNRAGVADAGGAAITDEVEADSVQILL